MDVRLIAFDLDGTTLVRHQVHFPGKPPGLRRRRPARGSCCAGFRPDEGFFPPEITSCQGVR